MQGHPSKEAVRESQSDTAHTDTQRNAQEGGAQLSSTQQGDFPTVITLGETMLMVTPTTREQLEVAENFHVDVGGAESNVASHLCALGTHAAWIGQFGDDALGRRGMRFLTERGIDLRWASTSSTGPTGVYFKNPGHGVQYYRAGSAASQMSPETVARIPLEDASIVHLSGITPALSSTCADLTDAVVERLRGATTLLSFDVNYRAPLWPVETAGPRLLELARQSDIVFVGLDEAQVLWDITTPEDVRALLSGVPTVVIKDGDVGATEFAQVTTFVPAAKCEVVEAVGAGDAFAAGYLHALLAGAKPQERLAAGHQQAITALTSVGDYPMDTPATATTATA